MLEIGEKAPLFALENQKGETIELTKILEENKRVMLVIYPKDDTPGCTSQVCRVKDDYSELLAMNLVILGLNHDNARSHQKFIDKYQLPFDILIDKNKEIIKKYKSTKMFFKNETIQRSVYIIDYDQTIIYTCKGQQDNQKIINFLKTFA